MADSHSHEQAVTAEAHGHAPAHDPADPHAVAVNIHEIEHHLKLYWTIGGVLLAATGLTVAFSYIDFDHFFVTVLGLGHHNWNMIIGLILATIKVSLVGAIFMHLKEERSTIWRFLYFTAFFVMGLFLLFLLAYKDPIFGTVFSHH
jgi:caa(3)-type oxidase subunit IV